MTVRVLRPGLLTTVQDLGRAGHQHEGIPESGAMDALAARLGNLLVGNEDGAAVLEMTLLGPHLEFGRATVAALTGASHDARLDGQPVAAWRAFSIPAGGSLDIAEARTGCRGYLAVAGGFDAQATLGSRSTYIPASFGGHQGRALRPGDVLASGDRITHVSSGRTIAPAMRPAYGSTLRFIPSDSLDEGARTAILDRELRVSESSDRMGYRLESEGIDWPVFPEALSAAVTMGTLQLPPGGSPILLMADRQTTGGYPVLGQVASVDLGSAAQLRPRDHFRLVTVSLDEAQRLYLDRERAIGALRHALRHPH